jgi:NADH-quinone oxidoreductase subunit L
MYQAILFLPLAGALIAGLFGRAIGARAAEFVTCAFMVLAAVLSWVAFSQIALAHEAATIKIPILHWLTSGDLDVNWSIRVDPLTAVMLVVVNTVSCLVHIYSVGYMHEDPHRPRFFAYLSLFTFAMLALVTSDTFLQLFFGWEGVGLMSYLLIGFWYERPSANAAAMKAFIVNRVGDFGFALGIFGTFLIFRSIDFDTVFAAAPTMTGHTMNFLGYSLDTMTVLCLLLFMGAMGKSAQFLLHTWLPDAMEGPTPVSALIHAATMVTAGVFMVARLSPMFEQAPVALWFVTLTGATTAFFAATVGLVQNDIKRVIAYSTCSQLGYMFAGLGVGAYGAGIFHLFTHAFFKALLFLGAGSVIHAMHHEQDMRNMGGLSAKIPVTWMMMLIGTLALTGVGIPGLGGMAGFYSKDAIIEATYAANSYIGTYAFYLLVFAAFLTSFYSWRLIFLTFHGHTRADHETFDHAHESPWVMLGPLAVLALGAIAAGALFDGFFVGGGYAAFWKGALFNAPGSTIRDAMEHVPSWVSWSPTIAMALGFALSWVFYISQPALPATLANLPGVHGVYLFLYNKWYFDELYDLLFVRPTMRLGRFLWKTGDGSVIDGLGPDGIAKSVIVLMRDTVRLQTGFIYHYAFVMLIGVTLIATVFAIPPEIRQHLHDGLFAWLRTAQ